MGFPRQEYWSGLPFLSSGVLSNLGIESVSPELQVDSSPLGHQGSPYANTFTILYKGFEHPWSLVSAEGSGANPLLTLRMNVFSKYSCGFCTFKPNVSLNGKALVCRRARKVNYLICKKPNQFIVRICDPTVESIALLHWWVKLWVKHRLPRHT